MIHLDVDQSTIAQRAPTAVTHAPAPLAATAMPGRVLLLFQPTVGGVPHYVANLAEGLAARGWEVCIAAPSDTPVRGRLERAASHPITIDASRGVSLVEDARVLRRLVSLCRRERVDLIHAHSSKAGAIAAFVGAVARVPSVYSPHAWSFQRELSGPATRAYVAAERMLARRHASVIAVSDMERVEAERHGVVTPGGIELIHTGLADVALPSHHDAREQLSVDPEAFVVGWVGRAGPQKRSEQLPALARELTGEAQLVALGYGIAGSDAGRELVARGGVVPASAEPHTVYAASDALAVTSRWEGFPLVVLEAMRAGLPVVAYDAGGIGEQVEHGVSGYLVAPGDVYALAGRLRELARDRELAARMGRAARRRFLDRFEFDRMVSSIEHTYQRVITSSKPR